MLFGPTNDEGQIEITREQILRHAKQDLNLFLMDHGHLEIEWTGRLTVTPHNSEQVEGALKAYKLYSGNYDHGPGYEENLHNADAILSGLAESRLTATVSCEPDESVTIETVSVMA